MNHADQQTVLHRTRNRPVAADPTRLRRMDVLNSRVVRTSAVIFDIGAHVDDRAMSFRHLGARVVAFLRDAPEDTNSGDIYARRNRSAFMRGLAGLLNADGCS